MRSRRRSHPSACLKGVVRSGLMQPDVEIMFAFSFFGEIPVVVKLAVTVGDHQAVLGPRPIAALRLWDSCWTVRPTTPLGALTIAGDRCQDQRGLCLNSAVTVLP